MSTKPAPPMTPPCSPLSDYTLKSDPPRISIDYTRPPKQYFSRHKSRDSFSSSLCGGFRTLIVDDNPINLNILERTLKRHFSHLVSPNIALASSGNSALSQLSPPLSSPRDEFPPISTPPSPIHELSQSPFDLILLDIDMPDISGIQVAEQIRNVHHDQATAIVAVTTSTHPEQQRTYEMVGMDGVVGKPIDLDLLDRVVTRALLSRRHHPRHRTSSVPPLSKEIVSKQLQRQFCERLGRERLSASSTDVSSCDNMAISRRSSFPLSLGEFHQIQESVSLENVELCDLSEKFAKTVFDF
jgi:CheY-like chemotaxis protein